MGAGPVPRDGSGAMCSTLSTVPSALRSSTPSLAGSGLPVATQLMMGSEPRLNSSSEASLMIWGKRSGVEKSALGLVVLCPMYRRCSDLSPVTSAVEPVLGVVAELWAPSQIPPHAPGSATLSAQLVHESWSTHYPCRAAPCFLWGWGLFPPARWAAHAAA